MYEVRLMSTKSAKTPAIKMRLRMYLTTQVLTKKYYLGIYLANIKQGSVTEEFSLSKFREHLNSLVPPAHQFCSKVDVSKHTP